ncbi:MAG: outer membrane beta-barrel protein [Proteobacteria bacterium]|nr:outer membrane beta-barrel protein [Pseudomonadota bacterium]
MKYPVMVLMILGLTGAALAEDFDYDFVSGSYGQIDIDDLDGDGDVFGLGLSIGIADNLHMFADYQGSDLDFGLDVSEWSVGIGFNTPISDVMDVVAQLSYEYVDLDVAGFGGFDDDGYGLSIGLRAAMSESVEINAGISYIDLSDSGDNTTLDAGFLFNVSETIALGVDGSWDDDVSIYRLTGRVYFGN